MPPGEIAFCVPTPVLRQNVSYAPSGLIDIAMHVLAALVGKDKNHHWRVITHPRRPWSHFIKFCAGQWVTHNVFRFCALVPVLSQNVSKAPSNTVDINMHVGAALVHEEKHARWTVVTHRT